MKIGVASINWWNHLIPLPQADRPSPEAVLDQVKAAGYAGVEVGDALPTTVETLKPLLQTRRLQLAAGFWPTWLLSKPYEEQESAFLDFLNVLAAMGTSVLFVAEYTHAITSSLAQTLFPYQLPTLSPAQWQTLGKGLAKLQRLAEDRGLKFAYHPLAGTIVQEPWQIERLLEAWPDLGLVLDTGHLALVGADPLAFMDTYLGRIVHIHLKNVRPEMVKRVQTEPFPWRWALIDGIFTVPGDGGIDFRPILEKIENTGYQGWLIVEAEQDPYKANPFLYARLAREYLKEVIG